MKSQLWQGDSWALLMRLRLIPLAASAFVLAVALNSCGGGDSSGPPAPAVVTSPVAKVVIYPGSLSPYVGQTAQLTATTTDPSGNPLTGRAVSWSTSSAATATVSASGLLTAVAPGFALITATSEGQTATAAATVVKVPPVGRRTTRDRPDEASGLQAKFVYFTSANGSDGGLDTTGVLENSVGSFQNWFISKTGKMVRQDTYEGKLDVVHFRSKMTDAQMAATGLDMLSELSRQLTEAGFNDANKKYLIYYDGSTSNLACGASIPDGMGVLYFAACGIQFATSPTAPPGYNEFAMLHELVHTRGYVDPKAPDNMAANPYHLNDQLDLMYGGRAPWSPSRMDSAGHNYYGDGVPAGVRNLKNDSILIPAPAAMLASARLQARALREHPQAAIPYHLHRLLRQLPRR